MWYNKHIYYLGENFALSLLTEICTHFGVLEFSLTATMSSHQNLPPFGEAGAFNRCVSVKSIH